MPRIFNALIGLNIVIPWIVSLILPIHDNRFLHELIFFSAVFFIAVGNARLAKIYPQYARWIWALSIGNLLAAMLLGTTALASALSLIFMI